MLGCSERAAKTATERSDAQLGRLFNRAERTAGQHKKAQLKEGFIREFYEGAAR